MVLRNILDIFGPPVATHDIPGFIWHHSCVLISPHNAVWFSPEQNDRYSRGVGGGGATGARVPLNFPVGGFKLTKLVGLDTVAALI